MPRFVPMSDAEFEAVVDYGEALLEGRVDPPEGVEVTPEMREAIGQAVRLRRVLRTFDLNSAREAYNTIVIAGPEFMEAALDFMPTARHLN